MKTIKLFLMSFILVSLISCSKKDDAPTLDVVGSWTMTQGTVEPGTIVIDMGGMQIPMEVSGGFVDLDPQNKLHINENGTFQSASGDMALELTLGYMGTTQTERFASSDIFGKGTWELNGQELKIKNENGTTIPYRIDRITSSEMDLSSNVRDMVIDSGSNPILDAMDITIRMKLKRI